MSGRRHDFRFAATFADLARRALASGDIGWTVYYLGHAREHLGTAIGRHGAYGCAAARWIRRSLDRTMRGLDGALAAARRMAA